LELTVVTSWNGQGDSGRLVHYSQLRQGDVVFRPLVRFFRHSCKCGHVLVKVELISRLIIFVLRAVIIIHSLKLLTGSSPRLSSVKKITLQVFFGEFLTCFIRDILVI